jgi:hypothetical protein
MPYRGVCSFDDLDILFKKYTEMIDNKFKDLNNKVIIHPTEQDYKNFWEVALMELDGIQRCKATYLSGKRKGERCRASPQPDSNYCLKHANQEPGYQEAIKQAIKSLKKTKITE